MLALFRLLMLLSAMETAPIQVEEPDEAGDEGEEEEEEETSEVGSEDEQDESDEEIRDPRAKLRAEQEKLKRLSGKLTRAEEELAELRKARDDDASSEALRSSRIEVAFLRSVIESGERYDLEAMWDLANVRGFLDTVEIGDDGAVSGIDDAIGRVIDRYPWLREGLGVEEAPKLVRTAPPPKKRKDGAAAQHSDASLREKFPALRKAGR